MPLTPLQTIAMLLAVALGAMITRFMPFLLFPETREQPKIIAYLGRVLPSAMAGFLVVYCLKSVSLVRAPYGLPELIAVTVTAALQKWRSNAFLSICFGTAIYMFLVQKVF
ncbi:MAG: branched-chain amino acid transporter permease [Candidatus Fimivivens sp.]